MGKRIFTNLTQLKNGMLAGMKFEVIMKNTSKVTINEVTDVCELGRGFGTAVVDTGERMFFNWTRECKFNRQGDFSFYGGAIEFRQIPS